MRNSLSLNEEVCGQEGRQSGVRGKMMGSVLTKVALQKLGETWIHIVYFKCLDVCTE